jgi:LPXTG-site transpeptidase (sortase) family protein
MIEATTTYVPTSIGGQSDEPTTVLPPVPAETPAPPVPQPQPAPQLASAGFERPSSAEVMSILGTGLTIFGAVVIVYLAYLFAGTALEHGRAQRTLQMRFQTMMANQQAFIGGAIPAGTPVFQLDVPRLHLKQVVAEGTTAGITEKGPGHLRTSPLPGQTGNVVVACRRVTFGGPCRNLDQLKPGNLITTVSGQGTSKYLVTKVMTVDKHQTDALSPTSDSRLTLMTSAPLLMASRRLVVVAQLQTASFNTPGPRVNEISSNELGLEGDGSNALGLLVWPELLFVAACLTAWLWRRWAHWPTWLVMAPVLALLLLLLFDSFTSMLPSTL